MYQVGVGAGECAGIGGKDRVDHEQAEQPDGKHGRKRRRGAKTEVSLLTWLRQIQCEAFEIAERAMDQGTIVGSTQDYPGRLVCIESFLPAGRT